MDQKGDSSPEKCPKPTDAVERVGVKVLTIVFLQSGQCDLSGPLGEVDLCRTMLQIAGETLDRVEAEQRRIADLIRRQPGSPIN